MPVLIKAHGAVSLISMSHVCGREERVFPGILLLISLEKVTKPSLRTFGLIWTFNSLRSQRNPGLLPSYIRSFSH